MKRNFIILIAVLLLTLVGGRDEGKAAAPTPEPETVQEAAPAPRQSGCTECHGDLQPDPDHNLACTACHLGNNDTSEKNIAHKGLVSAPAAPDNMVVACGKCHPAQTADYAQSLHFTLSNAVNRVRSHFGITPSLSGLSEIPDTTRPQNKNEFVDDMLRRRCLRCQRSSGDSICNYFYRRKR